MRLATVVLASCLLVGACTQADTDPPDIAVDPELVDAAYQVCPMLWQWQLSVGAVMNDMSMAARTESEADKRYALYLGAMDEARGLLDTLRGDLSRLNTRFTAIFAVDIATGLDQASAEIDLTERFVIDSYARGRSGYNEIVPPMFLSFEKVIDLAKPEMATYGNPAMIPSFREIPQCQFGVKDVDDGVPRYVPMAPDPTVPAAASG